MNIHTDLVKSKRYSDPIQDKLLKHSQEYRVLATLRYLFPGKYDAMITGESPDLQDSANDTGIEVTIAAHENDMKANSMFSRLCQVKPSQNTKKYKQKIESSHYSFGSTPWGKPVIAITGTLDAEKLSFQKSIRKKKGKLQKYRLKFKMIGLAVLLPNIPTSVAENNIIDWIREVFQESDDFFDFVYVISHRFCFFYDSQTDCFQKLTLSGEESNLLRTVARMTAEGELSLEDQEWQ